MFGDVKETSRLAVRHPGTQVQTRPIVTDESRVMKRAEPPRILLLRSVKSSSETRNEIDGHGQSLGHPSLLCDQKVLA